MITRNLTPSEYSKLALRTLSPHNPLKDEYVESKDGMMVNINNILHGSIGMATEGGECLDAVKKTLYYNNTIDRHNIIEECGDQLWYIAATLFGAGSSIEEAMRININKLSARYPDKFSDELAANRDLDAEREIIEGGGGTAVAVKASDDDEEDEDEDDDDLDDDDDDLEFDEDIEDEDDDDEDDDDEDDDDDEAASDEAASDDEENE